MTPEVLSKAFEYVSSTGETVIFPEGKKWYVLMELDKYKEKTTSNQGNGKEMSQRAVEKINEEIAQIAHVQISENPSIDNVFSYDTLECTVSKEDIT